MESKKIRYAKVVTAYLQDYKVVRAIIEVSIVPGLPIFELVGLGDSAIREAKERVRTAFRHSALVFPAGRITISLVPAYLHKSGSSFDLPMALGILAASGQLGDRRGQIFAFGELALTGLVLPVPGATAMLLNFSNMQSYHCLIPWGNYQEAYAHNFPCFAVESLKSAVEVLKGEIATKATQIGLEQTLIPPELNGRNDFDKIEFPDFSLLKGQHKASKALQYAAAGFHNILLSGSPGCGKTTAALILAGLLPPLSGEEQKQLLTLNSFNDISSSELLRRPFRKVFPSSSHASLLGTSLRKPGELIKANNGILLMDEITAFSSKYLTDLLQPMEQGYLADYGFSQLVRGAKGFILVGTMNPCHCGYSGSSNRKCICSPQNIRTYQNRLSGAFWDRIHLYTEMRSIDAVALKESISGHQKSKQESLSISKRIAEIWQRQYDRCDQGHISRMLNAFVQADDLRDFFRIEQKALDYAASVAENLSLSARGLNYLLRIARTIADWQESLDISPIHIKEAMIYRPQYLKVRR